MPKITTLVLPLVGHSLPGFWADLLTFESRPNICHPCSYFLQPPFPSAQAVVPSLLLLSLE